MFQVAFFMFAYTAFRREKYPHRGGGDQKFQDNVFKSYIYSLTLRLNIVWQSQAIPFDILFLLGK
jgi:hypothetical protein